MDTQSNHFQMLSNDVLSLKKMVYNRIKAYFSDSTNQIVCEFSQNHEKNTYMDFLQAYELSYEERVVLTIAIANEISPHIFDPLLTKNSLYDLYYTEFGGEAEKNKGFNPTIQTALFLLYGVDNKKYLETFDIFMETSTLFKNNILKSYNEKKILNTSIKLSSSSFDKLILNNEKDYDFTKELPAHKLTTKYKWDDLVFSKHTKEHLEDLQTWMLHHNELLKDWGMGKTIKDGYKALFYGPPGTGKSLTAALLGKRLNKTVYRIDLSQVVSKYIGETEKNLEKVFLLAEDKDWILFFDEADSLFGKRTQISSSNDRYANQGTSYLLQRIEECNNMIILASNLKDNFDEAYLRRFQSIIYFSLPEKDERLSLWKKGFSTEASLENVDLDTIAEDYEISGATIMNVIRYASLMAIKNGHKKISQEEIVKGIRREKFKEGKII